MRNLFSKFANILSILSIMAILTSCDKNDEPTGGPFIKLSENTLHFEGESEAVTITINSNVRFSASAQSEWIDCSQITFAAGNGIEYKVGVQPYYGTNGTNERKSTITFTAVDKSVETKLTVTQSPKELRTNTIFSLFKFEKDNNSALEQDVVMEIGTDKVTGRVPYYTNTKNLVATFTTDAFKVDIDGVEQSSGVTVNDFSKPVIYTLTSETGEKYTYTVNLTNFTGLPVMFITTEGNVPIVSKDYYVNGRIVIDGAGVYPDFEKEAQLKGRGNTTWGMPKKPYRIKFDKKQELLGCPAHKSWVLLANYADLSALRNETAFDISRATGLDWTPRTRFIEVFLNGEYNGTYQFTEMIKINENRVDVTDDGFIIEADADDKINFDDITFRTSRKLFTIKDPDVVEGDEKYEFIKNYVTDVENLLYSSSFLDSENGYKKYVDIESFADWYLVNEIAKNVDAQFHSSCYMNYKPGGKLKMGPVWDFDLGFGNVDYGPEDDYTGFWVKQSIWISRMFEDPEFVKTVQGRYAVLRTKKDEIINRIVDNANYLRLSTIENNKRWQTLLNSPGENSDDETWSIYLNEVEFLKNWLNNRFQWLDSEIQKL